MSLLALLRYLVFQDSYLKLYDFVWPIPLRGYHFSWFQANVTWSRNDVCLRTAFCQLYSQRLIILVEVKYNLEAWIGFYRRRVEDFHTVKKDEGPFWNARIQFTSFLSLLQWLDNNKNQFFLWEYFYFLLLSDITFGQTTYIYFLVAFTIILSTNPTNL